MATGTTSNDREFLFRLQTLIIDGGTIVIKSIFDQKVSNVPLNVFLATEKSTINRLRAQKTITRTEYDQLYPQSGQPPNSADFDITLLICLLRNIRSLRLNPNYSWNVPPQQGDTSVEADLCRLRGFRNEVAHISSTLGFQQTVFQSKWKEIENVLLRLNYAVPNPVLHLQQTIDGYKNDPLDPVAEIRIQTEIKKWREFEKGLDGDMQLLTKDVIELKLVMSEDVIERNEIKGDVKEITKQVEVLTQVHENVKTLTRDITEVKQHVGVVAKVRENVKTLQEDVTGVQANIEKEHEDVKFLKCNVKNVYEDVKEVGKGVTKVIDDVKKVSDNVQVVQEITEDIKKLQVHVEYLTTDVKDVLKNVESGVKTKKNPGLFRRLTKKFFDARRRKALRDDLILLYRDQHRTISLSPLIEQYTPLLKFYVMPDIYISKQMFRSGAKQERTAVTPLRNMFYSDNKMCRKIYLTADAGLGKTALSKRLTLAWCYANKPHKDEAQFFSQEEIQAVKGFHFVFLLPLRDSSSDLCDIDDFIMNQIISQLVRPYTRAFLENTLFKEKCLVILDGLDEWSHPSNSCRRRLSPIPHRKARDRTAVLTTTRPWKLSVSGLKSSEIDQKLEIVGLNHESTHAFKRSVISHLYPEKNGNKLQQKVAKFTRAVEEKQIFELEAIPLLLMYLLFLWCNKIELGQSQCELYSQITEILLSRTVQNSIEFSPDFDLPKRDIPQCFGEKTHCTRLYTLLTVLGRLAYQTLFRETREENTLVFDGSVAEQYLNKESLNFCLKAGLITQSKVPGTLLEQKSNVSFAHKTFQEFFAALYMHATSDQTSVSKIVLSKCKCIKDILEMSKIFQFSCGINVDVSFLISREMMKIINEDEITLEYRSNLESYISCGYFSHPLKDFQDMCISCCKEVLHENEVSLCLQDVFIERNCEQEHYRKNLKQLMTKNKQNIRSLYINMDDMRHTPYSSVREVIEYFALYDLECIEKIHYKGEYNDSDILPLLNRSVKCLSLRCSKPGSWSRLLFEKVTSLQKLEAIHIYRFTMSSSELIWLYDYISQRYCMRKIELGRLECTGEYSCTGYSLDLSQHSQLNNLRLGHIPVSELNIYMASLEKCSLEYLSDPDLALRFINCGPADSKLNTLECKELKSPVAIETMLEILRLSVHVKHVVLVGINICNREVLTSEMVNIERVELWYVIMTASVLQGIVDVVQKQPQTVTVDIDDCDIKPESEFVTVKQNIKKSRGHFRVLVDSGDLLMFETIKQGD